MNGTGFRKGSRIPKWVFLVLGCILVWAEFKSYYDQEIELYQEGMQQTQTAFATINPSSTPRMTDTPGGYKVSPDYGGLAGAGNFSEKAWATCVYIVEKREGVPTSAAQEYDAGSVQVVGNTTTERWAAEEGETKGGLYIVTVRYAKYKTSYECFLIRTAKGNLGLMGLNEK